MLIKEEITKKERILGALFFLLYGGLFILPREPFFKTPDGFSQSWTDIGQSPHSKNDHNDDQDHNQFGQTKAEHGSLRYSLNVIRYSLIVPQMSVYTFCLLSVNLRKSNAQTAICLERITVTG